MTLFPDMILQGLNTSIIGRAVEGGILTLEAVDIRDYADNKHNKVDDYPYGGGAGMVMQAEPVCRACEAVQERIWEQYRKKARVIYVTPQGSVFHQRMAQELAKEEELIFLCGHYEGIDERALTEVVTDYVSIGDYVLTGGELAAMVMIDAISRLVPGVLNNEESAQFESFEDGLLEYPQYSRPEQWRGKSVPQVLLSGDHSRIEDWRKEQSIWRTRERRPDLYEEYMEGACARKRSIKVLLVEESVLAKGEEERPWAGKLLLLAKELGISCVRIPAGDAGELGREFCQSGVRAKEALVLAATAGMVRTARTEKLRTLYLPFGEEEPEGLIYYKKLSDLTEAMAVIRRLS